MSEKIKLWGWDKKPRTMLRYIKVGDILCFEQSKEANSYGYARIISDTSIGSPVEILNIIHKTADDITVEEILNAKRTGKVFILNAHASLDNKKFEKDGEWRVIGRHENYELSQKDINNIFFIWGTPGDEKKSNILDEECPIQCGDAARYLEKSPLLGCEAKLRGYIVYD